jgi:hypothetical protein
MFNDSMVNAGMEILSTGLVKAFGAEAAREDIKAQERVFTGEEEISNFLSANQEIARDRGEDFVADRYLAKERGELRLKLGVIMRLKGAYSCYKAGMELETIRHILLAMASLCHSIGWRKAEVYLNQQNSNLCDLSKSERESQD